GKLAGAAGAGAKRAVCREAALSGYGSDSRDAVRAAAEPLPGPVTDALARECARLGVWSVFGLLERDLATGKLFNACALVGPTGYVASYRKIHLPCLGADRFTDPGDRPFAVHDLGGPRVGMNICFYANVPEPGPIPTLVGASS